MGLREGKKIVQVTLKSEIVDILDKLAKEDLSSRSAIAGRIIEDYVKNYCLKKTQK